MSFFIGYLIGAAIYWLILRPIIHGEWRSPTLPKLPKVERVKKGEYPSSDTQVKDLEAPPKGPSPGA